MLRQKFSERNTQKFRFRPLESVWLPKAELPEIDVFTQYVSFEAWENGECKFRRNSNLLLSEIFPV